MQQLSDVEFVEMIVKAIVNHPEDVSTERTIDERGVLITLHINQEDMGYVIGRKGQTARSIRTLLKIVGAKSNARVNLKIYEPEGLRRNPYAHSDSDAAAPQADNRMAPRGETPMDTRVDTIIDTSMVDNLKI